MGSKSSSSSSSDNHLKAKRWCWGLSLTSVVFVTLFWAAVTVITLTRTIPGWHFVEDDHTFFLVFAYLGGVLTLLVLVFGFVHIFYYIREDYEGVSFEKLQLVAYMLAVLFAYLVCLAYSWGFDSRFTSGKNKEKPFGDLYVVTLQWLVYNFAFTISGFIVIVISLYAFGQFARLWPKKE